MDKNILSSEEVEALLKKDYPLNFSTKNEEDEFLNLKIELGEVDLSSKKFRKLKIGDELVLDTKPSSALNIKVNGRVVAKGQLKISHRKFAICLIDIIH